MEIIAMTGQTGEEAVLVALFYWHNDLVSWQPIVQLEFLFWQSQVVWEKPTE